jgi:hypothetical protein
MARNLGKLMQILALMLLPAAMLMQLTSGLRIATGASSVSMMLILMLFGIALFGLGRMIEGFGSPRAG